MCVEQEPAPSNIQSSFKNGFIYRPGARPALFPLKADMSVYLLRKCRMTDPNMACVLAHRPHLANMRKHEYDTAPAHISS